MFGDRLEENYHVIKMDETSLPLVQWENHVERPLEICGGILESERHAPELKKPLLALKGCFRLILFAERELPISLITIRSCEDIGISKSDHPVVHAQQRVRVAIVNGVQPPVVDKEPQGTIILQHKYPRRGPLRVGGFDNVSL